jgi:hypothetical protein
MIEKDKKSPIELLIEDFDDLYRSFERDTFEYKDRDQCSLKKGVLSEGYSGILLSWRILTKSAYSYIKKSFSKFEENVSSLRMNNEYPKYRGDMNRVKAIIDSMKVNNSADYDPTVIDETIIDSYFKTVNSERADFARNDDGSFKRLDEILSNQKLLRDEILNKFKYINNRLNRYRSKKE